MKPTETDLRVEGLSRGFDDPDSGRREVLCDLSLTLSPGQTLAVTGPSGSGKSTLLNCLGALDRPDGGAVRYRGVNVESLSDADAARYRALDVGFVFQEHHLLRACTALENVLLPTLAVKDAPGTPARARDLLARVGLGDRTTAVPAELSGGERQRVAIARALINAPGLLLADEPTGSLDRATGEGIAELFLEVAREREVILVAVTHDTGFAARFSQQRQLLAGRLTDADGGTA